MGLLDAFDSPQMALAAGLLGGGNFGQALGRGMAGAQAVQLAEQRRREMEAQAEERRAMAEQRQALVQQAQAKQAYEQQFRGSLQGMGGPQGALGAQGGGMDWQALARQYPDKIDEIKKLAEASNFGRQAVARTMEVEGPGGAKMLRQLSQYGDQVAPDVNGYVAPQGVNLGNKYVFAKPQAGFSMDMGQSPESLASNAITMRGQNMTDARARDLNSVAQQANQIKLGEKDAEKKLAKDGQIASFDVMLGSLDRLGKHPGLARSVGITGAFPTMPGSESANFKAELDTFQSQAFLPMVSQLKGMGALSDAEGKKLTAAVGALNPAMGEKAFRESVARITQDMDAARGRLAGTVQGGASGEWSGSPKPATAPPAPMKGMVRNGYKFKGGDPSNQANWEKQ